MMKKIIGTLFCAVCLMCTAAGCEDKPEPAPDINDVIATEAVEPPEDRTAENFIKLTTINGKKLPYPLTAGELKNKFELEYDKSFSSGDKMVVWLCSGGIKQAYVSFNTTAAFEELPDDIEADSLFYMGNYEDNGKKPDINGAAFGCKPKKIIKRLGEPNDKLEGDAAFFYYFTPDAKCRLSVIFQDGKFYSFNYTGLAQGGQS